MTKNDTCKRLLTAAAVLLAAAAMLYTLFVGLEIDEEYALSLGFRLVRGDRLFYSMWEPHQLSALPPALLIAAYTAVTGTTTGVLLFVRVTMLVLKAVLSIWFYRSLRAPLGRTSACLLALVLFVFTPKWFLGPDYVSQQFHFTLAAFLFTGDDVFKRIGDLSGGERGRVSLAKLMLSEANFLILDEPTNHLDITSKEILENALSHYGGTVLYVSHDRYFINKTATRILDLTGKRMMNYIGNYDYYLEKHDAMMTAHFGNEAPESAGGIVGFGASKTGAAAETAGKAVENPAADAGGKLDWKAQKEEQARQRKRQNDLKKVEDEIHKLETRDGEIDGLLCAESVFSDVAKLMELNKEKEEIAGKLEVLYEKWEELAE